MMRRMVTVLLGMALVAGTASAASIILHTSLTSPPGVYFGNGNANSGFTVSTDGTTELGLSVILRYVGPIDPGTSNVYTVPTGPPPGHTGSAWGFVFSVNTRYNGGTAVLGDFLYTLNVTDLTTGNVGPILDPVRSIGDDTGFGAGGKTAGVTLSTQWGAQNSEAPSFPAFLPGFDPNARDLYEITLTQLSSDGLTTLGAVTVFADAAVPEPGTFGLIGFGLVMVALAARKRA